MIKGNSNLVPLLNNKEGFQALLTHLDLKVTEQEKILSNASRKALFNPELRDNGIFIAGEIAGYKRILEELKSLTMGY